MKLRSISAFICIILAFTACNKNPKFEIEGTISHADGKVLYFELFGINKTVILDSVKLSSSGEYKFKTKVPDAPEFYKLRIGNRFIHLGVDSIVKITVDADGTNFGEDYSVKGSRACELIRVLSVLQGCTLLKADSLKALYDNKLLTPKQFQDESLAVYNKHREEAKKIILENTRSPAAYFAIFQRLHNFLVFDPFDTNDNKYFSAVATAWDTFYPDAVRSKNLVNLTLQGLKEIRRSRNAKNTIIKEQKQATFFEISLPNIYEKNIALSSLIGKVVLLDFTAYQSNFSPDRNLSFRELYRQYADKGFEIYQVSLDRDLHFWKTGAANLPWICVHEQNGSQSEYLSTYYVTSLPTYFLIDRKGNMIARDNMIKDLNKEIMKLL